MSKPKEYWIRQGTNGFSYKVLDEDTFGEIGLDLGVGDCFYDSVITEPAKNSIHVIEYSAYEKLQEDYAYIKREWESACERAEYKKELLEENIKLTGQVAMLRQALEKIYQIGDIDDDWEPELKMWPLRTMFLIQVVKMSKKCEQCKSTTVHDWTAYYWLNKLKKWLCVNCIYKATR